MPLYIGICFLFHPVTIGIVAIVGALLLVALTFMNNRSTQSSAKVAHEMSMRRNSFLGAAHRNAEVIQAMGMTGELETPLASSQQRISREIERHIRRRQRLWGDGQDFPDSSAISRYWP